MSEILLETNGLTKQYGKHKAVDHVNMHIPQRRHLRIYRAQRRRKNHLPSDDQRAGKAHKGTDIPVWI